MTRWVVDRNGDGFPDDCAVRLVVDAGDQIERDVVSALLDLAARVGLETHALPFPLVVGDVAAVPAGVDSVVIHERGDIPAISGSDAQPGGSIPAVSDPPAGCLTHLFTLDGLLEDRDGDLLPDASRVAFDLPEALPAGLAVALANLAARIGLESGGLTFPLVRDQGASFVVRPGSGSAILRALDGGWLAEGDAGDLARLIERVAATWPHIDAPQTGGAGSALARLRRWLAGDGPEPNEPGEVIFERDWTADWEGDRLVSHVEEVLAQMADEVDSDYRDPDDLHEPLIVFACEPPEQRRQIKAAIEQVVAASPFTGLDITVLSAFKTGLSWLREVVIPELTGLPLSRVRVEAMAHTGEYLEDDETVLDMQIRWLQELFPGNELISEATGLAPDAIEFVVSDDALATFVAEAFDEADELLGRWECEIPSQYQPFIAALPDAGLVRVTTAGTTWYRDGEYDATLIVPTDLDTFWTFWQDEIIPAIFAHIDAAGGPSAAGQPFFGELLAEVWISAPNERLGIREENDSAAEALAEDIYFTTLDAIELYGRQQTGERCNAPGAVIPIVHVTPGQPPRARVTLRAAPTRRELPRPDLRVAGLRLDGDELVAEVKAAVNGDTGPTIARLSELAGLPASAGRSLAARVTLAGTTVDMRLPLPAVLRAEASSPAPPPMTENIHGDAVIEQAARLTAFPEVTAWIEDVSYQGRPLVALALAAPTPGRLVSTMKSVIFKPTHLIIARHHANEVSSTNAAFQLAWLTATDPDWRSYLDRVNVVLLPYENPDGAALHVRLAAYPEARTWKHHPARYNALGYEFGEAHFDPDTRIGEARARTALWQRWPADVVVDNHGVPSHEWVQPFAGFGSPPRFPMSYWIVQALLYGIVRYV
ncbi:MAG TPA: M14 family zinc carboxypeptidase, partial [Thermomicrobiales bacterium]|nr:M14 family zinc carboxypeptidase [Thermomicrobiales bacterium]